MDADQSWTPDPGYGELGYDSEEEEYQAFLEREGLASPKKRPSKRGCASVVLLGVLVCALVLVLL